MTRAERYRKPGGVTITPVDVASTIALLDETIDETAARQLFERWTDAVHGDTSRIDLMWAAAQLVSNLLPPGEDARTAETLRMFLTMLLLAYQERVDARGRPQ